jgi:hypothetical protein
MGYLARQSRLAQDSRSRRHHLRRCIRFPMVRRYAPAEGTIDRHSQEALVVVVGDYDADTPLLAHGAHFP